MTKEEILEYFKDINAVYNDCTRYDTLSNMLDKLIERVALDFIFITEEDLTEHNKECIKEAKRRC